MKAYWDSSALVAATMDAAIRDSLSDSDAAVTRPHSFAEVFSTLTGSRLGFRVDARDAAKIIRELADDLEIVELSSEEIIDALGEARPRGVRGGQVHDYLQAVAAKKEKCKTIVTLNESDFEGLFDELEIQSP